MRLFHLYGETCGCCTLLSDLFRRTIRSVLTTVTFTTLIALVRRSTRHMRMLREDVYCMASTANTTWRLPTVWRRRSCSSANYQPGCHCVVSCNEIRALGSSVTLLGSLSCRLLDQTARSVFRHHAVSGIHSVAPKS